MAAIYGANSDTRSAIIYLPQDTDLQELKRHVMNSALKQQTGYKAKGAVDWDLLFDEWINSGRSRGVFLKTRGFDLNDPTVKSRTRDWTKRTREAYKQNSASHREKPAPLKEIAELWQIVQGWRRKQAKRD